MSADNALRDLTPGTQLANRYSLVRKLGQGGEAETWLASDRMTRSEVALKIQVSKDANRGNLHREWQGSIRLMHPHIVRVFEYHDDAAGAFYSLQFIDGPDAGVLTGQPPDAVLPVIAALADALRYAHGREVVHRDVKAANVLLDRNGSPYLIDFGVAAAAGDDASGGSLISASPATLAGAPAEPADDIFALGGLAYELLSGRSPYSGTNTAGDIQDHVPPPVTSASGEPLSPEVVDLVARMLDKDASARPNAEAVVAALADLGIRPGVAPKSLLGDALSASDEVIEAKETVVRRASRVAAASRSADTGDDSGGGLGAREVGIALAVLVILLLGVVFLLPRAVDEPPAVTETGTPAEAEAEEEPEPEPETERAPPQRDERVEARQSTEAVLGRLLSNVETLEARAVERWANLRYQQAQAAYKLGDEAFLDRDYATATAEYEKAIAILDPLLEEVDDVFDRTLAAAEDALENADSVEALKNFDLAVAISPGSSRAQDGLERAQNLDEVLSLVEAGLGYEDNLELDAAAESFRRALEIDSRWRPAREGLARVEGTAEQMDFDSRMSEGLAALAEEDFESARAAFRMAERMRPNSSEPADGLMQVDQGIRLARIRSLEGEVASLETAERWEDAVQAYDEILELDADLAFAQTGRANAANRVNLHKELDSYIDKPDSLSAPATMQRATNLVVSITRMGDIGPRLTGQRDELARLLKRAATPLIVRLVSDNATEVSIYKVGRLGRFERQELELRPGTYVAAGSRAGYRDVRIEFTVAPEIDMQPVVVRCEDPI